MRRPGRERTLGALSGILIAMATPAVAHADQLLEGETLSVPAGQGGVVSDSAASGGQALKLWSGATATTQIDAAAPYGRIWLHAKGMPCDGSGPAVRITVDGRSTSVGVWSPTAYRDFEAFIDITSGVHSLGIAVTNYVSDSGSLLLHSPCDRSLVLDSVTFKPTAALFAADSWRNRPFPDTEAVDPNSAAYVTELQREVHDAGAWVNTSNFSTPVYTAGVQVAPRQVEVDQLSDPLHAASSTTAAALRAQWSNVPLPGGARPSGGSDASLVVYQPATDTMWEFWRFSYDVLGNPRAVYGGRIEHVSQSPAYYQDPPAGPGRSFGAASTSIPLLAGVQRIGELQTGEIDHAVDFSAPGWQENLFRWPAQRTDDASMFYSPPSQPLPEGIRFRLPPSLDIDALGLPPYTRMLAKAVQRYGMIMDNAGGAVAFNAESPKPGQPDPYGGSSGIFGGQRPDQLLASFPWDRLEAIADSGQP